MSTEVATASYRSPGHRVTSRRRSFEDALLATSIGVLLFWWFTGGSILNPTNLNWILTAGGDPLQHYTGWQFFRRDSFFQWPLGSNPAYGENLGSSIVFTDSIPLFALLFKPLNAILAPDFQYFGIWILCCFILQAVFAWSILSKFTHDRVLLGLAACFFVLSPSMLWRLYGHEALVGHWLILAAINVFLSRQHKGLGWALLLCIASLIHAYLLAMVASIWLTDIARSVVYRQVAPKRLLGQASAAVILLAFTLWGIGYFFPGSMATEGYGWFRFNLLSFLNPLDVWSVILSEGAARHGEYEGFAYLGAGVLGLILIAIGAYAANREKMAFKPDVVIPLGILAIGFVIYAASNHVAVGPYDLITYDLPGVLNKLTSTFRSSGRFVWPVIYLLQIVLFVVLFRKLSARPARLLLALMLAVQIVDLSNASSMFKARWGETWTTPLKSAFWEQVPDQYRRVAFAFPVSDMAGYGPIELLAARNDMSVNGGVLSRMSADILADVQHDISDSISTGRFREDSLYVFTKDYVWQKALLNARSTDFVGVIDGYRVLAPSWKGCTEACGAARALPWSVPSGVPVDFSVNGQADQYLTEGWSAGEGTGRWTNQNRASLILWLGQAKSNLKVTFRLFALVNSNHPTQRVNVSVNGVPTAQWVLSEGSETKKEFDLDPAILASSQGFAEITLGLPDAVSPKQIGMGDDPRKLGVFVNSVSVSY